MFTYHSKLFFNQSAGCLFFQGVIFDVLLSAINEARSNCTGKDLVSSRRKWCQILNSKNHTWLILIAPPASETLLTCNSGGILKKMVGRWCVIQGCSNTPDHDNGISVHVSTTNKSDHDKCVRFVRMHWANFDAPNWFMVSSEHFEEDCF